MRSIVMASLLVALVASANASPLWGALEPGEFDVGFSIERIDAERPLEVMLWYPGDFDRADQAPYVFGDYAKLVYQLRGEDDAALQDWLSVSVTGNTDGLSTTDAEAILSSPMRAMAEAEFAEGEFPLVVWTMRYETMTAQSVLSEHLASHGYVVAFVRYQDTPIPAPWTIDGADAKAQTLSQSVDDLSKGVDFLSNRPEIDASNVAVVNWSYAAEASPQLQTRNDNVRLVVGLSSNPLSSAGIFLGNEAGDGLVAEELDANYVILSERVGSNGQERVAPEILNELALPSHYVAFEELAHGNFNVVEGMIPGVFDVENVQPWSLGGPLAKAGYESICRHVLGFMDLYLSTARDEAALKALDDRPGVRVTSYRFGPTH